MNCHICNQKVEYPDGVNGRHGKRIYHKECIRQKEFIKVKPVVKLELQDVSQSDDPLTAYLERKGWSEKLIQSTQESISRKLTIDLFGKQENLSSLEISLQNDIDSYYQWRSSQ